MSLNEYNSASCFFNTVVCSSICDSFLRKDFNRISIDAFVVIPCVFRVFFFYVFNLYMTYRRMWNGRARVNVSAEITEDLQGRGRNDSGMWTGVHHPCLYRSVGSAYRLFRLIQFFFLFFSKKKIIALLFSS